MIVLFPLHLKKAVEHLFTCFSYFTAFVEWGRSSSLRGCFDGILNCPFLPGLWNGVSGYDGDTKVESAPP